MGLGSCGPEPADCYRSESCLLSSLDSDDSADLSFNESIVSAALADISVLSQVLSAQLTTIPSVSTTLATAKATPQTVLTRPTQGKLLKLFRPKENLLNAERDAGPDALLFSPHKSFLALCELLHALQLAGAMADVKAQPPENAANLAPELYTLRGRQGTQTLVPNQLRLLKRYAIEYAARTKYVLPSTPQDVEIMLHNANVSQFDRAYGLLRILEMFREKLWNSVVLPSRSDAFPGARIDCSTFVSSDELEHRYNTTVLKNGSHVPWAAHKSRLAPAGVLRGAKTLGSTCSPTLGKSVIQYTIKG
ncbi:hypothetical protein METBISCDRAFT_22028 [Metschnikowia bicuspidata]|uniref:Uncharacterized protein n=1 Tax=Metschnikowia bicuspidata TaxID=27322 RepID=A0A4P9ZFU5_9ASCO|nr:hypothetical protein METBISCDRAFT_22028 [Metschnikowia bicuspidata]